MARTEQNAKKSGLVPSRQTEIEGWIDVSANRNAQKWTTSELVGRFFWELASVLFRFSPRPLWNWRNMLLRIFGAKIGKHVHIHPSVSVAIPWHLEIGDNVGIGDRVRLYDLGKIVIGSSSTISQEAHLCAGTHDHRHAAFPLLKSPITVGKGVWICADAYVGPGTSIGDHAIVGARAVVVKSVPPKAVVAGNPAKVIGWRTSPSA